MHDPRTLRKLARRCRERAEASTDPELTEQFRRWAVELADAADVAEWNENDPGDREPARKVFEDNENC